MYLVLNAVRDKEMPVRFIHNQFKNHADKAQLVTEIGDWKSIY
jgi:hypothetical protein